MGPRKQTDDEKIAALMAAVVVMKKEAPSLLALVVRGGAPSVLGRGRSCGEGLQGGDGAAEKNLL